MKRYVDRWWGLLGVLVVAVSIGYTGRHDTSTVTVCGDAGCEYATIQAAIDAASTHAGDTILLLDPVHTEADILVHKSVTIEGEGASRTVVQAAGGPHTAMGRVFSVARDTTVTISDLTIRYGRVTDSPTRGGGILNDGTLTLERCGVSHNQVRGPDQTPGVTASGGGIYNRGTLTLLKSAVSENVATGGDGSTPGANGGNGHGGGLANDGEGVLVAINSTISGNSAIPGAGNG